MIRFSLVALSVICTFLATSAVAQPRPLRVGAAKVEITPAPDTLPAHYGGVLDPVYARAIVVDNGDTELALVTVDVISLTD